MNQGAVEPKTPEAFSGWLAETFGVSVDDRLRGHYDAVVLRTAATFQGSELWRRINEQLPEWNDEYQLRTGFPLLVAGQPELTRKPFESFVIKMFRKNVLENPSWPEPPNDGWWLPPDWLSRTNDLVRTSIRVKYLDGIQAVVAGLTALGEETGIFTSSAMRATPEGYYAAHLYFRPKVDVPKPDWDTEEREMSIEIQVTTQIKDVITELLHKHYVLSRVRPMAQAQWQWSYRTTEFAANYLGHILHYVEGMIMDLRDRPGEADE